MEKDKDILITASWVSTIGNSVLSAAKIIVGIMSGSLAVLGDGIDSATDVVISVVMIVTAKIMNRPPDKKFVFGYDKIEFIATKLLSFIIFYAGIQVLIITIQRIFSNQPQEIPSVLAIYVTLFSILGKLALSIYQYRQGKKINSQLLIANAVNMRNDIIISLGVMAGLIFTFVLKIPILDSVAGLVVSLFIIRSAINIFIDSSIELMDGVKDLNIYNNIFEAVELVEGASNPHRVRSRKIGNMYIIALDIEVDGDIPLYKAHEIADCVENSIKASIDNVYDIVVHIEPKGFRHCAEKFGIDKDIRI